VVVVHSTQGSTKRAGMKPGARDDAVTKNRSACDITGLFQSHFLDEWGADIISAEPLNIGR
jgi:hypothetical protein